MRWGASVMGHKHRSVQAAAAKNKPPEFRLPKSLRSRGHKALLAVLVASRREAGLTQRQLADRLSVPPSVIGKVEIGERRLDVVEFTAIARALKLEPTVLYERFLAWERAGRGRGGK
jgi:ribosome-binding protein aMBF1 (putative translation factor)